MAVSYQYAPNDMKRETFTSRSKEQVMHIDAFLLQIKNKSDKLMDYFLICYFIIGILLSFFYDTWSIGIGVGSLSLIAYYSVKFALPNSNLYQYVLSFVFGIFMAQFIYQMHGLFEMHFIAFVGSTILITYQNWKLQIPLALVVIVHHASFGYLQYIGYSKIYFTQLDYMTLQTFIIHGILASTVFYICGLWAYHFKKYSERHIQQTFEMGRLQEEKLQKEAIFRMSENLKVTNEQLNEAQKMAHIGNWTWDLDTNHVYRSDEIYNIFERTPTQLAATPEGYLACIHSDDLQYVETMVGKNVKGKVPFSYEARVIMPDKKIKTIFVQGKPVREADGSVKIHGTIQDITERKKHEQALEESNAELRKSNQELDKFVYSVSHDLRAPLLSMQGVVDITCEETTEELTATHMKMLSGSINRLDHFIGEILTYSRNARSEINSMAIDFRHVINDVINDLQHMGGETKHINISVDIDQNGNFATDHSRFRVIMNNLISNAIRYRNPDAEKPYVKIRGHANGDTSMIEVEDNGIGIPKECQPKIYDMFYRVSENSNGSGLGLYIVKETVEKLRGEICFESDPGSGTKFTLTLPNLTTNNLQ
jgi:signal transduction histidine kinase